MGFKVSRTVYNLQFTASAYDGLEIKAQGLSIDELQTLAQFVDMPFAVFPSEENVKLRDEMFTLFIERTISWNIEDDNGPLPVSVASMRTLEPRMTFDMMRAWFKALVDIATPLESLSSDTSMLEEASIPMEAESESPGN